MGLAKRKRVLHAYKRPIFTWKRKSKSIKYVKMCDVLSIFFLILQHVSSTDSFSRLIPFHSIRCKVSSLFSISRCHLLLYNTNPTHTHEKEVRKFRNIENDLVALFAPEKVIYCKWIKLWKKSCEKWTNHIELFAAAAVTTTPAWPNTCASHMRP